MAWVFPAPDRPDRMTKGMGALVIGARPASPATA